VRRGGGEFVFDVDILALAFFFSFFFLDFATSTSSLFSPLLPRRHSTQPPLSPLIVRPRPVEEHHQLPPAAALEGSEAVISL